MLVFLFYQRQGCCTNRVHLVWRRQYYEHTPILIQCSVIIRGTMITDLVY